MPLADEVRRSARALEGAAFALAHTLRHSDASTPPATTAARHEAEAVCISTRAVLDELVPLEPLLARDAAVVGKTIPNARVRNGFDALATILVTLLDNATAAVLDVAGTLARPPLTPTGAFERMTTHHGQLRAMYGILHLAAKVVLHADVAQTLFVDVAGSPGTADLDPMKWREAIKMDDFYGRYFGFHYAPEMRNVLRIVNIARGSVDTALQQDATAEAPALVKNVAMLGWGWVHSNMVIMNNLGLNIASASKIGADHGVRPSVESLRTFMNLVEDPLVAGVAGLASADTAIDHAFCIPAPQQYEDWRQLKLAMLAATEDMVETEGVDYELLYDVFCSVSQPVSARLMSSKKRPANLHSLQPSLASSIADAAESSFLASALKTEFSKLHSNVSSFLGLAQTPPASGLIIHFHGGGFVSQSSLGHSVYLKEWCADMPDAVILSIDYKLSPEHRFPTALHECVYAYQWALAHAHALGTTADRVVLVGDSAGGNLALATALLAGDIGLRRPDGVALAYPSLYVSMAWSPSRLLSFFDPLLPLSVLELCVTSYLTEEQQVACTKNVYISPVVANRQQLQRLPPVTAVCGELDPLLDDSALLADRLHRAGRSGDVFRIYESMPHGFLNMVQVSERARAAMAFLATQMAQYLRIQFRRGNTQPETVAKNK